MEHPGLVPIDPIYALPVDTVKRIQQRNKDNAKGWCRTDLWVWADCVVILKSGSRCSFKYVPFKAGYEIWSRVSCKPSRIPDLLGSLTPLWLPKLCSTFNNSIHSISHALKDIMHVSALVTKRTSLVLHVILSDYEKGIQGFACAREYVKLFTARICCIYNFSKVQ